MVTLAPAFMLLTLTYVLSFDVQQMALAVLDQDHSPESRRYIAKIANQHNVALHGSLSSYADLDERLLSGELEAGLVVPPGFGRALQRGETSHIHAVLDGSDPTAGWEVLALVSQPELQMTGAIQTLLARKGVVPLDIRTRVWYNAGFRMLFSTVPGLMGVVLCVPAMTIGMALAREREHGTLEGLMATPVRSAELMVGKLVPYLLSGLVSCGLTTLVATLWFGIPFRGHWLVYGLLTADFLLATLSMSLLLSTFVGSQQAATMAVFLTFFLPSFFLSGLIQALPRQLSPSWFVSQSLPSTYFVIICRGIFLKGLGLEDLWRQGLALAGLGLGSLSICVIRFPRRLA